jgi:hypothetical protein
MPGPTVLTAHQITEPGAYEWLDNDGVLYVGFIRADSRGRLMGSFISSEGSMRAMAVVYSDNHYCEGRFFGPLQLAGASGAFVAPAAL